LDFEAPAQLPAGIPVVRKAPFVAVHVEAFHGFGLYLKDEPLTALLRGRPIFFSGINQKASEFIRI
jgi:hypothetical protein